MDSIEITTLRTGGATGLAAKYLARSDSKKMIVCGCGNQGRISVLAIANVLQIEKVFAFDTDHGRAKHLADDLVEELGIQVEVVTDLQTAVSQSDICVTCTPSRQPFLKAEFVTPGTFVAAVGADNPEKQELEPSILRENKLVVDVLEQSATIGELHHALNANLMTRNDVYAELGEVVAGRKSGRSSADETIVFDSTGMALQDVVTAAAVFARAVKEGVGSRINFAPQVSI
jgi:ornithine cyclodeaminase/alanine dehydrogenase